MLVKTTKKNVRMLIVAILIILAKPHKGEAIIGSLPPVNNSIGQQQTLLNPGPLKRTGEYLELASKKEDRVKMEVVLSKPFLMMTQLDPESLKRLRGGGFDFTQNKVVDMLFLGLFIFVVLQSPEAEAFVQQTLEIIKKHNAPTPPSRGYFDGLSGKNSPIVRFVGRSAALTQYEQRDHSNGPSRTQTEQFAEENSDKGMEAGYQEALRRGRDSKKFNCSKERFVDLATEAGNQEPKRVQEAISVLQLEADGHISRAERIPVHIPKGKKGPAILGADFTAISENEEFTGVPVGQVVLIEFKGPVSVSIKLAKSQDPSIYRQGKSIGLKIPEQAARWKEKNVLFVVDLFDLPVVEKYDMQSAIEKGVKSAQKANPQNKVPPIKFINNVINR